MVDEENPVFEIPMLRVSRGRCPHRPVIPSLFKPFFGTRSTFVHLPCRRKAFLHLIATAPIKKRRPKELQKNKGIREEEKSLEYLFFMLGNSDFLMVFAGIIILFRIDKFLTIKYTIN